MRCSILTLVAAGIGAAAASALADDPKGVPRLLLDRRLQQRQVMLVGIDTGTIRYTDAGGLVRNEPASEYLAILPVREEAAPAQARRGTDAAQAPAEPARLSAGPVLELTDGQRFAGSIGPGAAPDETVRWTHPLLGLLEFKLDQVRRMRLHAGAWTTRTGEPAQDDLVILTNGDRLEGFVEGVGPGLKFSVGQKGKSDEREVTLDRVSEVHLANPPTQPSPQAAVVWLRDGSVIACRVIRTTRLGELTLSATLQESEAADIRAESPAQPATMGLDDLLVVSFQGAGASLVPLATLTASQSAGAGRRWSPQAQAIEPERAVLGAADIDLPGPMTLSYELPAGAARLACEAVLPHEDWTWGDCELIVRAGSGQGEQELFRQRINAETPSATIAAQLPAGATRLTFSIDPGAMGPIQDHLVLVRPMLLVEKK